MERVAEGVTTYPSLVIIARAADTARGSYINLEKPVRYDTVWLAWNICFQHVSIVFKNINASALVRRLQFNSTTLLNQRSNSFLDMEVRSLEKTEKSAKA